MTARVTRATAIVAVALAGALGACGGGSSSSGGGTAKKPDRSGAAVFASAGCGSCHTLAAAHARGAVGPNLDTLRPSAARVRAQVVKGGGVMPAFRDQLSKAQIRAVAAFVAREAGR